MSAIAESCLAQIFGQARTYHKFTADKVSPETLRAVYDACRWAPTAMNCQPARYVFIESAAAKAKLIPCLSETNRDKTLAAPVTALLAADSQFFDYLPTLFKAYDARTPLAEDAEKAKMMAFMNGYIQVGYFILAARAVGLDCGPMAGFDRAQTDAAFFPDGRFRSLLLVNLGYGDASGVRPRAERLSWDESCSIV